MTSPRALVIGREHEKNRPFDPFHIRPPAVAALLLTFRRLADMVGRPTIWLVRLGVFAVGWALSGAAPSLMPEIVAWITQGGRRCAHLRCEHRDPDRRIPGD